MTGQALWQAEDVVRAVRGSSLHEQSWQASGVSIDSRTVVPGDLFVAIKGPAQDGHDYVAAAFANGAAAAIVSRQPAQAPSGAPLVFVEDTLEALRELGRAGRERTKAKIIAVTGSVGKTSSKEMLRLCLSAVGHAYANPGSLNNHWGLPLSLANLPPEADFGVFELGMNHAGELSDLSRLARPHVALITTVEAAHLEFFANVEAIADAKAEIFEGMEANGAAILNRDNPHYARLAAAAKNCGVKKILSFGHDDKADARLAAYAASPEGGKIDAVLSGTKIHYTLGAAGKHLALNSLGVLLACTAAGANAEACAMTLARYSPPKGRGVVQTIMLSDGMLTLIDDSYNANPASVRASIGVLASRAPAKSGRRILVLGDMRELGKTSSALHAALAENIIAANIDLVFCCGAMMRHLYEALPEKLRGGFAPDSAILAPLVADAVRGGDIVTVKGSNSMNMPAVIAAIKTLGIDPQQKKAV
ncbi:MAG: UDP-N-acetylmuramoylalanyl-D-glutamyl-2,6-diaminopimelate--D-alanyl-D-alanine ligase [Alphaproteobacteria bacterium]|nr:UDP-N-acetylmuramoylalanyl-D-glutamyl-2,6-diaminopimelate--D-alanyl-D-alanine ligase [Alphaproteobacteria bacterium]